MCARSIALEIYNNANPTLILHVIANLPLITLCAESYLFKLLVLWFELALYLTSILLFNESTRYLGKNA